MCEKQGEPHLEVHHVIWLSRGEKDALNNVVAVFPNCHTKMHIVDDEKDVLCWLEKRKYWYLKIESLLNHR